MMSRHRDQAQSLREMVQHSRNKTSNSNCRGARFIAVSGGKGGVGKSNISLNLALSLGQNNHKVVVLDTDFGLPNLDILVGCAPQWSIADVVAGRCDAQAALHPLTEKVSLLAGGDLWGDRPPQPEEARRFLQTLAHQVSQLDYLIIDTQAGTSPAVTGLLAAAELVLMVVVPEPTSVMDAYRTIKQVEALDGDRDIGMLINRSNEKTARRTFSAIDNMMVKFLSTEARFLGWIPEDKAVRKAVQRQTPLVEIYPKSRAARSIVQLAEVIDGDDKQTAGAAKGFLNRLADHMRGLVSKEAR